jgi:hypothetical protein
MGVHIGVAGLSCAYSSLALNSGSGIIIYLTFLDLYSNGDLFLLSIKINLSTLKKNLQ